MAKEEKSDSSTDSKSVNKFLELYEKTPVVITPNNATDLKLTLDDAIKKFVSENLKFKENFKHVDIKLLLGYSACAFAGLASIYSFLVPFPDCKPVLLISVIGYFIMNGLMVIYTSHVEQNIIYLGTKKDSLGIEKEKTMVIRADMKRELGEYILSFELQGYKKPYKVTKSYSVGEFFDVEGQFAANVFCDTFQKLLDEDNLKLK